MLINRSNILLVVRSLSVVIAIIVLKMVLHHYSFEFITINNLFSGIVAANVFLMGFLLSGVLADYKESEKIPTEMAVHVSTIYDDLRTLPQADPQKIGEVIEQIRHLGVMLLDWFHRSAKTNELLSVIENMNRLVSPSDGKVQANYIIRLKQELTNLKRLILRADTIRDTHFISSGYLIATFTTTILCAGLLFSKINPFYESVFFVGAISFLMIFLLMLIRDLDNPFAYSSKYSVENISLQPIKRINSLIKKE